MNSPSDSDKEKVEKKENNHSCSHCKREFSNYHALGGHLKSHHHEIMSRRKQNRGSTSHKSVGGTNFRPILMKGQANTSFGGTGSDLCESKGNCSENSIEDAQNTLIMSPNFQSNGNIHASLATLAQFGGIIVPSPSPMDQPMYMGPFNIPLVLPSNACSIGNSEFNINDLQSFVTGFRFPSTDILPNIQHHNHYNLPNPSYSMNDPSPSNLMNNFSVLKNSHPHPVIDINKIPGMNEPIVVGLLPLTQTQSLGSLGPYDDHMNLTCERVNKHCLGEVQGNSSPKRPRITPSSPVCQEREMPQKKELPLLKGAEFEKEEQAGPLTPFKDGGNLVSAKGKEIATDTKGKGREDLDLSLHL